MWSLCAGRAESWQKHFHDELDARREDWPAVQAILDREDRETREAEEDDELPVAKLKSNSKKRKAVTASADSSDDSHSPVYPLHYHALSAALKAALLYLHTSWMLHDHAIHAAIAEGPLRDTAEATEMYGLDDQDRRYWLFPHCEWGESRVHLYRETMGAGQQQEERYSWELLACTRDQLEEQLAVLMVQTADSSRALAHRIQYEALEYMGQPASQRDSHTPQRPTPTGHSHTHSR